MTMHAQAPSEPKTTTIDLITENDPDGKYYAVADLQIIVRPTHVMFNGDMETLTAISDERASGPGDRLVFEVPPAFVARVKDNPNASATFFVETLPDNTMHMFGTPGVDTYGYPPPHSLGTLAPSETPPSSAAACPSCGRASHAKTPVAPPRPRCPLAAKIEQAQRPASVLIRPHAEVVVSCLPRVASRVIGLDITTTYLCGVCQGEGVVGTTVWPQFRVTCPACAGAKTANLTAQPVQPPTPLVRNLTVGASSQMVGAGPVPVTAFKSGFIRTDVIMPGMMVTISFINGADQPVRISGKVIIEPVSPLAANVGPIGGGSRVWSDLRTAIGQRAELIEQYPTEAPIFITPIPGHGA